MNGTTKNTQKIGCMEENLIYSPPYLDLPCYYGHSRDSSLECRAQSSILQVFLEVQSRYSVAYCIHLFSHNKRHLRILSNPFYLRNIQMDRSRGSDILFDKRPVHTSSNGSPVQARSYGKYRTNNGTNNSNANFSDSLSRNRNNDK